MSFSYFVNLIDRFDYKYYFYLSWKKKQLCSIFITLSFFVICTSIIFAQTSSLKPLRTVIDLKIGESVKTALSNGEAVTVVLRDIKETTDALCEGIRISRVKVSVNGQEITINSGNYNLPVIIGNVQIDCPITKGYYKKSNSEFWGLVKDARLRLWPANSPFITPGTFVYPVNQRWFATMTQMSNEPTYVDGGEYPRDKIYYHSGLDIGGAEKMVDVLSATDGLIVSSGEKVLPNYDKKPVQPRYDVIYILDDRGWYYRYSHLNSFDPSVLPGQKVKKGQKIGVLGKEGGSGGWAHLHFEIISMQPSGKWGTEEGYAYLWESYIRQFNPPLIAVARPHFLTSVGDTITLDGGKSRSFSGDIAKYEWLFSDASTASGSLQKRSYNSPGEYSEVLKISDSKGNIDYDFAVVQVLDKNNIQNIPPTIHAAYFPTFNIKPGDPVTFKVRSFNARTGNELWDFGDGSSPVKVKSVETYTLPYIKVAKLLGFDLQPNYHDKMGYAETVHSFAKSGHYLVKVERMGDNGLKAVTHLHVEVVEISNQK